MEVEIWKPINGYEGLYEVSNMGKVKRLSALRPMISKTGKNTLRYYAERLLRPQAWSNGYLFIMLSKDKKTKQHSIHRLVAQHFIPNPEKKPEVNHKTGNKNDNRASELEWCTPSENQIHSYKTLCRVIVRSGPSRMGAKNKSSKSVVQTSLEGILIQEYASAGEAARSLGTSQSFISACCTNKQRTAFGYKFNYKPCS